MITRHLIRQRVLSGRLAKAGRGELPGGMLSCSKMGFGRSLAGSRGQAACRYIGREVETRIGRALLAGDVRDGAVIRIGYSGGELSVSYENSA